MQMSFCRLWRLFDFSLISASFNLYQLFKELHQNLSGAQLLIQNTPRLSSFAVVMIDSQINHVNLKNAICFILYEILN